MSLAEKRSICVRGLRSPNLFSEVKTMVTKTIEIVGKCKGKTEVLDEANNKKDADEQVDYWQAIKGRGWKITTKPKR